jgi:hypothetical protein
MKRIFLILSGLVLITGLLSAQQAEYDRLKAKIEAEDKEPSSSEGFEAYIHWLGVKAEDRDLARDLASKYAMEGNPYWEKQFMDLMELAHDSGESTLLKAEYLFVELKSHQKNTWPDAVDKAELFGKRLFLRAVELSFDSDYIRERVRCLMRFALGNIEMGDHMGLYDNRDLRHGTQMDSEGNYLQPDMDFEVTCLPRSAFHVASEGTQARPIDKGLADVEKIRDVCEWFELFEYNEGTDLMNQFLLDFLCDDKFNREKNLNWYLSLARKHKLEKSEKHILGFYGTLYGKVEVQEGEQTRDAPGARVQVTDDTNTLKTEADGTGNYTVEKAPLHCKCPPVPISAEFEGDRVDTKYQGELKDPDPDKRQKKDLLIMGSGFAWTGSIELEITHTYNCDVEEQTGELSIKRILAGDHKTAYASISIGLSDFNLPATGTSTGARLQYISGQVTVNMREDHTINGSSAKSQCHNDGTGRWEWVSPGNWNTWNETKTGQAYADIEDEGITLMITKEMPGDRQAKDNMQQQVAEMQAKLQQAMQSMDKQATEKIKAEMRNMMQGDQNDATIPIKAVINISFGARNYPVYTSRERKSFNVCTGEYEENESRSETIEVPLILPFSAEMKGEYTRGRDGNDRIEATIEETKPFSPTFGSGTSCPEGTITVNGNITLERKKE